MRKLRVALAAVLLFSGQLLAQKSITGTVTDDKGIPIPNASVVLKGTNSGTVTKADGSYTITVPSDASILVFSAVGMSLHEVNIGSQTVISPSMRSDEKTMDEIVVTS